SEPGDVDEVAPEGPGRAGGEPAVDDRPGREQGQEPVARGPVADRLDPGLVRDGVGEVDRLAGDEQEVGVGPGDLPEGLEAALEDDVARVPVGDGGVVGPAGDHVLE